MPGPYTPHGLVCLDCREFLTACAEVTCPYIHDHSRDNLYCETCETIEIQNESAYVLKALLRWADQMGGWDAPIWERAKKLVALIDREPYTPPTVEEED